MKSICLLGATGSVGQSTLAVVAQYPEQFCIDTLSAHDNAAELATLCHRYRPQNAIISNADKLPDLVERLGSLKINIAAGEEAMSAAVKSSSCETVVLAIAGTHGVKPALAAALAGKRLLLANKESIVFLGRYLQHAAEKGGGQILPIDSEHCALFDLLHGTQSCGAQKIWLTASGGAVRDVPIEDLAEVSPEKTLQHPNWSMGKKVTVDSATMMNKVLETIEASVLFGMPSEQIGAVLHPQSIFHALVEYCDGFIHANLSLPTMQLPIARMLTWPQRLPAVHPAPDWATLSGASFFVPDPQRYPCLALAEQSLNSGGGATAALSAANEVAVQRFLNREIKFTDIFAINAYVLERLPAEQNGGGGDDIDLEQIWHVDNFARQTARAFKC